MSWMDSWSRPGKHAAVPPPLYLTQGDGVLYCQTCGRVISPRKSQNKSNSVKYCSDRCRNRKSGPVDKSIEQTIVSLLDGEPGSGLDRIGAAARVSKGDRRIVVTMDEIEEIFFGARNDPTKSFGRKKNRASRALGNEDDVWKSVDMVDSDATLSDSGDVPVEHQTPKVGPMIRPPQIQSEVNGSIGGEKGRAERKDETAEELEKRLQGKRKAEEREMVRRAARRGIVFGFEIQTPHEGHARGKGGPRNASRDPENNANIHFDMVRRKCEALMNGAVVEPSFAKGDWAIRWRE